MLLCYPILYYFLTVVVGTQGFVTITPECSYENSQIYCSCKTFDGIQTRFGNDLLKQIHDQFKGQTNLKIAKRIIISNCDTSFKFTLDLDYFKKGAYWSDLLDNVHEILIENTSPFNAYFSGTLRNGDLNVTFRNIHGHDDFGGHNLKGSVVLTGGVDYCTRSCQTTAIDQTGPPSDWTTCNDCIPSNIRFNFVNVDHVYLRHFGIAAYEHTQDEGHAILHAQGVQTFKIDDKPFLSRVEFDNIDAKQCYLEGEIDCNSYGSGSSIGAEFIVIIAFLTLAFQA